MTDGYPKVVILFLICQYVERSKHKKSILLGNFLAGYAESWVISRI